MIRRVLGHSLVTTVAVAVLGVTLFSQHPNRSFDRFRAVDKLGFWLPNWRFFAPEPAQHDYHILHRTLDDEENESAWTETYTVTPRKAHHIVWFPDRRTDKALFDAISEVLPTLQKKQEFVTSRPAYRAIENFVRHRLTAGQRPLVGFQFMVVSSTGFEYALAEDPSTVTEPEEILISPFIPLQPQEAAQ
ncbi:hypothetical protein ACI2IX_19875 [Leifsonia aquatica]|uniref:hypothetical protein n=1 Tax=Leifsonia aquatica TaxID=144185 RepID=UPI00384FCE8D